MLYLVSYDITDDGRRNRVADALKDFGHRVQYSVFEALLDPPLPAAMRKRLQPLIETTEDSIRIYTLCGDCRRRIEIIGVGERTEEIDCLVV